jgi:hypothetical protein
MLQLSTAIMILVCALVANSAIAAKPGRSAMNQNGSAKAIAQLRCSWKNVGAKPIVVPARQPHRTRTKGKACSLFT